MMRNWILFLLALLLSSLVAYRAYVLPITHDEASTWLNLRHLDLWSCLTNPECWGSGNNHWLNTLLLQWSTFLFGDAPFALRLPNVLGGMGYIVCALLISVRYTKNLSLQCAGFLLLCAHTYLLDFFSLTRGYGLMTSGVIWAIYSMLRYIEKYDLRWLAVASSALTLAIFSNFTALLPWAVIGLGWVIWLLICKKFNQLFRHGWIWMINAGILFLLLRFPIKTLAGSGEFGWGSKNLWEMISDLVMSLLYGARIFGNLTSLYFIIALGAFGFVFCCFALLKKNQSRRDPVIFMALVLFLNFLVIFLNQKMTGALAPIGRKSIYLIPFIFGFFALGLQFIPHKTISMIVGVFISLVLLYHLYAKTLPSYVREWYYDGYYPELVSTILPMGPSSDSIYLSSSWIFNPALSFYQQSIPLPLGGLPYQRPLVIDSTMDYYFVESSDTLGMHSKGYMLHKNIGPFYLFRNIHSTK